MKPHLDIAHIGTLGSDGRRRMTFDENSVAHLMSILTDMYSDTELAPIREYSTNAADSHRAAGVTRPIEVTLPTGLNPVFIVKDYGVGLSPDDVIDKFSKYGWSSKRDNDTETGMLGLGCKSALTYTSQFTMIVTKDGVQSIVLVTRDPDGAGVVQIVESSPTDDPNGVEVHIPVKSVGSFCYKANQFFSYWNRGEVLVDESEPAPIWESPDFMKLNDDVIISSNFSRGSDRVVMGGVAYPVDPEHKIGVFGTVHNKSHFMALARVPIGAVDFTPSREALHYTKRTLSVLDDVRAFIQKSVEQKAQGEIDAAPNHTQAIHISLKWKAICPGVDFTYKSKVIPRSFEYPMDKVPALDSHGKPMFHSNGTAVTHDKHGQGILEWNIHYSENGAVRKFFLRATEAIQAIHIVGYPNKHAYAGVKQRIAKMRVDNKWPEAHVFAYPQAFTGPWLEGARVVRYEDVAAIELPKVERIRKKTEPGYQVLRYNGDYVKTSEHPRGPDIASAKYTLPYGYCGPYLPPVQGDKLQLIVLQAGEFSKTERAMAYELLDAATLGKHVGVVVTKTRLPNFMKEHPTAVLFYDWLAKRIASFQASITPFEMCTVQTNYPHRAGTLAKTLATFQRITSGISLNKVLDPDLRAILAQGKTARNITAQLEVFDRAKNLWPSRVPLVRGPKADQELVAQIRNVLNRYPLVTGVILNSQVKEEGAFLEYINALYVTKYQPRPSKAIQPYPVPTLIRVPNPTTGEVMS